MSKKQKVCDKCLQELLLHKVKVSDFLTTKLCNVCRYRWNMVYLGSDIRRSIFAIQSEMEITLHSKNQYSYKCKAMDVLYDELKDAEYELIEFFHNWNEQVEPDRNTAMEGEQKSVSPSLD